MDKDLREALRVGKNLYKFYHNKLIKYNFYVSETFFGTFKDYKISST